MDCNKSKFADEKAAIFYIKKLKDTSTRNDVPVRAYLCPDCNSWHITKKVDKMFDWKLNEKIIMMQSVIDNKNKTILELEDKLKKLLSLNQMLMCRNRKKK